MSLYTERSLRFEFNNLTSNFEGTNSNKISISNVAATVSCQSSGNLFGTQVNVSIYGLGIELLAALSSKAMGLYGPDTEKVSLNIYVEDITIFAGFLTTSVANMAVPNAALLITATANADLQNKTASPFSYNGATPLTSALTAICKNAGYSPLIVGLEGKTLTNPHYSGSVFDQLEQICYDMKISMSVMSPKISFWDAEKERDTVIPLVSPENGLVGYPLFSNGGVMFQTQFSSLLTTGRRIQLLTSLPHASGNYTLTNVTHELSSWVEDGPWHSICIANKQINGEGNG
ncbi:baseplate hub protein [Phytobacter ursingii]